MRSPLQQVGHADYRSTNHLGFPSVRDKQPVGDVDADYDNDPEARQSSLDRMSFTPKEVAERESDVDASPA